MSLVTASHVSILRLSSVDRVARVLYTAIMSFITFSMLSAIVANSFSYTFSFKLSLDALI